MTAGQDRQRAERDAQMKAGARARIDARAAKGEDWCPPHVKARIAAMLQPAPPRQPARRRRPARRSRRVTWRQHQQARAARREERQAAKRAVLLRHSDPVAAAVAQNAARIDEQEARAAEREARSEARFTALFSAMGDACQAAGLPAPDKDETAPLPRLHLVREGESA
jgi:hypothetical protein